MNRFEELASTGMTLSVFALSYGVLLAAILYTML